MSVDPDALVNQALFTFARFNGYVTPGAVAAHARAPGAQAPSPSVPPVAQPLASPPSASRRIAEPAPPPASPAPEIAEAAPTSPEAPPRMATGPVPAVPPAPPATHVAGLDAQRSVTPPEPIAAIPTSTTAAELPQLEEPDEALPPDDEALEDGLDALPENGPVEWQVPKHILANRRIAVVRGTVKGRDFQGRVEFFDAKGAACGAAELGAEVSDARIESVLANEFREPGAWKQLAQELAAQQHLGEATIAMVRAVGAGEPVESLTAWFSEHSLVRTERAARERAQNAGFVVSNMNRFGAPPPRKASYLTEELLQGAFPAMILRELAIDQDQFASSKAASDLIRCAKALSPADKAFFAYTQALIEMTLGNPDASRVCADELREASEEQADFLTTYLNGLFPSWDFWPAADPAATVSLGVEAQPPVRKLSDFRNAIQKSALRMKDLRDRLLAVAPEGAPWVPPALDAILSKSKATLSEGEDVGLEEWQERNIPQLLRFARNEWARLTWLCWLAGLDAVGAPSATSKPRSWSAALRAHELRLRVFALKAEETALEDALEGDELEAARTVAGLEWLDSTPADVDAANATELGVPESTAVLQAFRWASDLEVPSPFFEATDDDEQEEGDDEGDGAEEEPDDGGEAPPAQDDVALDEREALAEQPATSQGPMGDVGTSNTVAREAVKPAPVAEEPAGGPEEPSGDRTAIVRPSGRKLWVRRDGQDTIELVGMRFTVGRDPRCEIVIPSPRVSREHAAILVDAETVLVTDLNSSNGTFFNGERVMRHVVNDGDVVQFGNEKVTFHFSDPG